jgi:hypothetical protein
MTTAQILEMAKWKDYDESEYSDDFITGAGSKHFELMRILQALVESRERLRVALDEYRTLCLANKQTGVPIARLGLHAELALAEDDLRLSEKLEGGKK